MILNKHEFDTGTHMKDTGSVVLHDMFRKYHKCDTWIQTSTHTRTEVFLFSMFSYFAYFFFGSSSHKTHPEASGLVGLLLALAPASLPLHLAACCFALALPLLALVALLLAPHHCSCAYVMWIRT
jgi:hypothetical protein